MMKRHRNRPVDRRGFLAGVAGAAAATMASPGLLGRAAEQNTPWKMRLSASTICFTKLSVEKACQRIASLGFEAVVGE